MLKSRKIVLCIISIVVAGSIASCKHKQQASFSEDSLTTAELTNEDSPRDDELKSLVSMEGLLSVEPDSYYEQIYEDMEASAREKNALELANRVVTMYSTIDYSNADNVWIWAEAVDYVVRQYAEENKLKYDTAVYDLHEALSYFGYEVQSQASMNDWAYYSTIILAYDAVYRYKRLIDHVADPRLKVLVRAEYNAWFEWMDAQCFTNAHYTHGADYYSALPIDLWIFHKYHIDNRLATLDIEEDILVKNKPYQQKGKTVTGIQWQSWLDQQGYRDGMSPEFNMDEPTETDFIALIKCKTERWISARQAVTQYLGDRTGRGQSYDFVTADIHACIIGLLKSLVAMGEGVGM